MPSKLLEQRERIRRAEAAATGDDDVGVLDRGPLDSSCVCSTSVASVEKSENSGRLLDLGASAGLRGVQRAGADDPEPRGVRPADVDQDRVTERGAFADELLALDRRSVRSQLSPASSRAARPAAISAASTEAAKRTASGARLLDERGERIHPRLGQRRREFLILGHAHLVAPVGTGTLRVGAPRERRRSPRRERRLRENAEPALLELAAVVLEKDEQQQISEQPLLVQVLEDLLRGAPSSSILT